MFGKASVEEVKTSMRIKMGLTATVLITCFLAGVIHCSSLEPKVYSRFDWEDKLLQKVIESNMMMKQYMDKLDKALETMTEQTQVFERTKRVLEQTNEDIRIETANRLKYMDRMSVPTVAFNVRKAEDTSPAAKLVIKFQHVLLNLGGAYDEDSGKFTAPVNGTYMFGAQVCSRGGKYGIFQVAVDTKENVILAISDYEKQTATTSTSGTSVAFLTVGQKVWVQNQYSSSGLHDHDSQCWNQFTGTLIHI